MPMPLDALEAEVLKLPVDERSHLLDRLIASLETDTAVQQAWELEAERRDAEIDQGTTIAVSGPELVNRLRTALR